MTAELYLGTLYQKIKPSGDFKSQLLNIAFQPAALGGDGVYYARAMLNLHNEDTYSAYRHGRPGVLPSENRTTPSGIFYPNPTNNMMSYSYSLTEGQKGKVEISNTIGTVVAFYKLDSKSNLLKIDTGKLPPGIYYAKVIIDGSTIQQEKLVVLK